MRNRDVGTEGGHLHVADLAFLELDRLVLHLLDGLCFGRPVTPAVSLDIAVSQVLLKPSAIAIHLGLMHLFFELLNLSRCVSAFLRHERYCHRYRAHGHPWE